MEHIALYRQFRPMTFDEIVEQKGPVSALRQSVISGKIGHAYIFSGQRGTGKTTISKVFSRAINCINPVNGNPCNECDICKGIINGSLMDVIEIDAASNNSVDNIRRICEEVNFAPAKASHKVYIIDEVHMLSTGAFNALLKTLEEPPKHVVFLLATTEPHRIPATIHSRCQRYDFKRISIDSIVGRLKFICSKEGFKATDDALSLIASLSDGAMRDAISLLDQAGNSTNDKSITRDTVLQITGTVDDTFMGNMARALINGDYASIINMCEELANSGRDITRFSVDLAQYFRDLLVVRMMPDPTKLVKVQTSSLKTMYEICQNVAAETLVAFISKLSAMISDLKWTPSVRTTFEITLIQLCGRKVKIDPVPLVIPDFVAKQQAFANSVSPKEETDILSAVSEVASVQSSIAPEAKIVIETKVEEPKVVKEESPAPSVEAVVTPTPAPIAAPVETPVVAPAPVEAPVTPAEPVTVAPVAPSAPVTPSSFMDDLIPPPGDDLTPPPAMDYDIPEPPPEYDDPGIPDLPEMDLTPPPAIEDTPVVPAAPVAPAPVAEPEKEPVDPEDLPMENQIDLFSIPVAPVHESPKAPAPAKVAPAPVKVEEPVKEETPRVKPSSMLVEEPVDIVPAEEPKAVAEKTEDSPEESQSPLLAMINSSFLDDIPAVKNDSAEPKISTYDEPEISSPFWEPAAAPSNKVHHQTSLASVMQGTELLTAPDPKPEYTEPAMPAPEAPTSVVPMNAGSSSRADLQMIWQSIYKDLQTENYLMFVKLCGTELQTIGDSAYIVFDDSYNKESIRQLTSDDLYKKIRNDIMAVLSEIEHVFVATQKQFRNVLASNGKKPVSEDRTETKLDSFLNAAKQNGIDLHFGDD